VLQVDSSKRQLYYPFMGYKDPDKQRVYMRKWLAARRAAWLAKHGPCVVCGSAKNLEIDHKDCKTKLNHRVWSWSEIRRNVELEKCQVLCKPCHVQKGYLTGDLRSSRHGTPYRYEKLGCRCAACTRAHTVYQTAWRKNKVSSDHVVAS